ncbi:cytochrome P450 [Mycena epipterygia]|nr:cytochrome P450 [Mycena epipterygia]
MSSEYSGDIPGPFLARWTHLWLAYHAHQGRRYKARYGPVIRIAPNHVSIASPDAIPVIYGQGQNSLAKSTFYDAFVCNGKTSMFSTRDRQDHATKRRLVSHAFSTASLQEFIPLIYSTISQFTTRMDELCDKEEYFDAVLWFNYLAFDSDVLSDLAFGERIGMIEPTSALEQLGRRQALKRLLSPNNRGDILGKLIEARGYNTRAPTADEIAELTAESVTLLIAGSDTTSNSIAATLHFVVIHPRVYKKLMGFLLDASNGLNSLDYESAKDIPYLLATIKEGLRFHSTTAIGLHRLAPSNGILYCERHFPGGTELSVPAWTISHDRELWGDPENFRPERWLERKDTRQYLLAFGKGPRACMISVITTVLLRYKIEVKSAKLETTEGFMHKPLHLWLKLSRRPIIDRCVELV